tara:strand:+ start:2466 stop:2804 length:339 start_codon:yes stop_codon:yes gene_type:complete
MTSLYFINGNSLNNGYLMGNIIPVNTEPQYLITKNIYVKQDEPDYHFIQNGNTYTLVKNEKPKNIYFIKNKKDSQKEKTIYIKLEDSKKSNKSNESNRNSSKKTKSYNWPLV